MTIFLLTSAIVWTPVAAAIPTDFSDAQIGQIESILAQKGVEQPFTADEAALLVQWLGKTEVTAETFAQLAPRFLSSIDNYAQGLKLNIAEIFSKNKSYPQALDIVEGILKSDPKHYDALFLKGDILQSQKEYLKAVGVYEEIEKSYPNNQAAANLKIRALMDMGANSLALEKIEALGGKVDPVLYERVRGNKAMYQIRWQEPAAAVESIDVELQRLQEKREQNIAAALDNKVDQQKDVPPSYPPNRPDIIEKTLDKYDLSHRPQSQSREEAINHVLNLFDRTTDHLDTTAWADLSSKPEDRFSNKMLLQSIEEAASQRAQTVESESEFQYIRSRWDKIVALRLKTEMEEVVKEYEEVLKINTQTPAWVREAVADAYLYLRQPHKALRMYEEVLEEQPQDHNTRMAVYHTLVELGRYKEATRVLENLDRDTPPTIWDRGLKRENWKKFEIVYSKAWLLMYQDKLAEAEEYLRGLERKAPANSNILTALAHDHLWRGWPRKALKDFEVVHTMDPDSIVANNGRSLALNANGKHEEARDLNEQLLAKEPKNRHLQRTKRMFEIEEMRTLTIDGYLTRDFPGEDEVYWRVRGDQPVNFHYSLFAELIRRETTKEEENDILNRAYVGNILKFAPTWKLTGAISQEYDTGDNFGWLTDIEYAPNDYWTLTAGYDSHTLNVPLRSRTSGVDATEADFTASYRHSELFNTLLGVSYRDFTDGNEAVAYIWNTSTALTTGAYWKTRLGTEYSVSKYSKSDVDYFSPGFVYSFMLVPMVEHTWYRRYEKALVDRLYVGAGQQWQRFFGAENIGYVRYEQDYKFSDTWNWLIGTTYSLRNYDGGDVNTLNLYTTLRKNF